jgi:hypothetical protein
VCNANLYTGRGVMCMSLSNVSLALQTGGNLRIHLDLHFSGMLRGVNL